MRFHLRGQQRNRPQNQSKPYFRAVQTVLENNRNCTQCVLKQDVFSFLDRGVQKKISLKIGTLPLANRARNRARTAADYGRP